MIKINLGDEVQDTITGIKGIAVGISKWIAGCNRITVQPKAKQGSSECPDSLSFDEPLLKIIKKAKPIKKTNTGGPMTRGNKLN